MSRFPFIDLPDDIRVPLHEVWADLPYAFGRASAEGHDAGQKLALSQRIKLEAVERAVATKLHEERDAHASCHDRLVELEAACVRLQEQLERSEELADKYKWQVRDTCASAEKAEAALRPLARLELPRHREGNASIYSLLHADIEAAKALVEKSS